MTRSFLTAREIDPCPDINGFFRNVVDTVRSARRLPATDAATSYVVALLVEFAEPKRYAERESERPLTVRLHDALNRPGPGTFEHLRQLGDFVLYVSGFFGEYFERRGVTKDYVRGLGAQAYWGARQALTGFQLEVERDPESTDIFRELAGNFDVFVNLLEGVCWDLPGSRRGGNADLLELYERWLKTRSPVLAAELTAAGLIPQRGTDTVH